MSFRLRRRWFDQLMLIGAILAALENWVSKAFAQTRRQSSPSLSTASQK